MSLSVADGTCRLQVTPTTASASRATWVTQGGLGLATYSAERRSCAGIERPGTRRYHAYLAGAPTLLTWQVPLRCVTWQVPLRCVTWQVPLRS